MKKRTLGIILLTIGLAPILVATFSLIHGIVSYVFLVLFGSFKITLIQTAISMGFFVALLIGFKLVKSKEVL